MDNDDNVINFDEFKKQAEGKLKNLGKLSPVEYGQRRNDLAGELGVRGSDLDKEYRERRKAAKSSAGTKELFREIEPWEQEIDGQRLLADWWTRSDRICHQVPPRPSRFGSSSPTASTPSR